MKTYIILLNNYPYESSCSSPDRHLKQREMKKFGSIFNNQTLPIDTLVYFGNHNITKLITKGPIISNI